MFTEESTRLCGEIVAMRKMRGDLMNQLHSEFRERAQAVSAFCSGLTDMRKTMAKNAKQEREVFLNNLKQVIAAQQHALRSDLAGARRAWAGKA